MVLHPSYTQTLDGYYSRSGGPWDVPPLPTLLDRSDAGAWSIRDGTTLLDGRAVTSLSRSLASTLLQLGTRKGDVVAWQMPNWHESVLLFRACWSVGAIALPLHHKLREADIAPVMDLLHPKVTFAPPGAPLGEVRPGISVRNPTSESWTQALGTREVNQAPIEPTDLALAMMTSGSTGAPKVVLHSHRALAYKAMSKPAIYGLGSKDCVLVPGPLSHINGIVNAVLVPPIAGMNAVLMEAWDPEQAIRLVESEGVTFLGGASTFLSGMVESAGFSLRRVRSLRLVAMGGSSMSTGTIASLAETLGCSVKRTYGATEAPSITTAHAGDPPMRGWETDGRPSGEAEVRISDPTTGSALRHGETGEIWVRGPELFAGYAIPEQTTTSIQDGWFRTGDLGSVDEEGWLTVRGRIKELIIRGGENISPGEVEALVRSHPSVQDTAVVGFPDRILGERVAAVVVADPAFTLQTCREWFAGQKVAKFKTPEMVMHVPSIPLLATGKPDKIELRRLVLHKAAEVQARSDT